MEQQNPLKERSRNRISRWALCALLIFIAGRGWSEDVAIRVLGVFIPGEDVGDATTGLLRIGNPWVNSGVLGVTRLQLRR